MTTKDINKEPTDKQINCVNIIVNQLGISPPTEFTLQAYSEFISEHMEESKAASKRRSYTRTSSDDDAATYRRKKWRAQREADWRATHGGIRLDDVLNGCPAPSWSGMTNAEFARHLRSLGERTIAEMHEDTRRGLELFSEYE